ncbi:hypothetical protein CC1G_01710 [Coprinopsis cinerea okayama7|uniref:Pentatricopeptide repeat-containing protein n=1 Tax=Coprinopsis cinerea (strain Okayama-7 / 130 / ATCC MYA-4618 / FGSC 9003) TaxID=240176 RepID=A8N2J3_COPC7|nr:hypothetical protein CC1G_01710 [Coprinopsis cinerea okayama7\|eukprot:XP_001829030.1 hypothetical protein CC1G_01710 [Coprinopsis cinerea okayama7\
MLPLVSKHWRPFVINGLVNSLRRPLTKPLAPLLTVPSRLNSTSTTATKPLGWTAKPKPAKWQEKQSSWQSKSKLTGPPTEVQEENALRKALQHRSNLWPLLDCLWEHLKANDSQSVLRLYAQYVEGKKETTPSPKPQSESPLAFSMEDQPDRTAANAEAHHNLVLAAIAAHAMEGSFEAALGTFRSSGLNRWPEHEAHHFLQQFGLAMPSDQALRNQIGVYFRDVRIAHWLSIPTAFSRHVKALAKARSLEQIWSLYWSMYQGITRPSPFISPSDTASTSPHVPQYVWGSFLASFFRCDRYDLAKGLWETLEDLGVHRDVGLWTTYLDGLDHLRLSDVALSFWEEMKLERVQPDCLSYRAIISVCLRDDQIAAGMDIFQQFKALRNKEGWSEEMCRSVYNTVLDGLLMNRVVDQAKRILEEMRINGPAPDAVTYNIFLGYFHRRGDFAEIGKMLSQMDKERVVGDVYTFSILLTALLRAGRPDAVDVVVQHMNDRGIKANVAIYTTLIEEHLKMRTESSLIAVMKLLDKMKTVPSARPNDVTYTSILTNLYRGGWLPKDKLIYYEQEVLQRMKAERVHLNLPGYHAVLRACFERPGGASHAMSYYREIKRRNIPLVQTTWYILVAGLLEHRQWQWAREIVEEMKKSKITPSASLARLVMKVEQGNGSDAQLIDH